MLSVQDKKKNLLLLNYAPWLKFTCTSSYTTIRKFKGEIQ